MFKRLNLARLDTTESTAQPVISNQSFQNRTWFRIYLILALSSLTAISTGLYIVNLIVQTHVDSIAADRRYDGQLNELQSIGKLADSISQDIESRHVGSYLEPAAVDVQPALAIFKSRWQALQGDIAGSTLTEEREKIQKLLTSIDRCVYQWASTVMDIHAYSRQYSFNVLLQHKSIENNLQIELGKAFVYLRENIALYQEGRLDAHLESVKSLRKIGIIIGVSALFAVCGAIIFGFKMKRQADRDAHEKDSYIALLHASPRSHQEPVKDTAIGMFLSTQEGIILGASPAFAHIFGYDSETELLAKTQGVVSNLLADPACQFDLINALQKHSVVSDFVFQALRKDGSIIWASENARMLQDETDNSFYIEGFIHDITNRKAIAKTDCPKCQCNEISDSGMCLWCGYMMNTPAAEDASNPKENQDCPATFDEDHFEAPAEISLEELFELRQAARIREADATVLALQDVEVFGDKTVPGE